MIPFDIIGALRTAAQAKGWAFLFGSSWIQNYEASQNEYQDGQLILGVDFDASPIRYGGKVSEINYAGTMILGRKFDPVPDTDPSLSTANLDETDIQKYDRRLLDLTTELSDFINEFSCSSQLTVTGENMRLDLNKFDTNIDFIANSLTFIGDGA